MSISPAFGTAIHSNAVKALQILKVKIIGLIMICTTIAAPLPAFAANTECGLGYIEQIRLLSRIEPHRALEITLDTTGIEQPAGTGGRRQISIFEPGQNPVIDHEAWQTFVLLATNAESSRLFVRLATRQSSIVVCATSFVDADIRVCTSRAACLN